MRKLHVKKGDTVVVISGKDKGNSGKIVRAIPKHNCVVVEGLNLSKKHQKARKGKEKGQIVDKAMPIHVSNVKKSKEAAKSKRKTTKKSPPKATKK